MITVINDIHADPKRVGGTTLVSREELGVYVVDQFDKLLYKARGSKYLVILGDLFNSAKAEEWFVIEL